MNVRVQVNNGTAVDVTKKALKRISKICDILTEKFSTEFENYKVNAMRDSDK